MMSDTPEIATESAAEAAAGTAADKAPATATESEERRSRFASRRGRLGACTGEINEIKALMADVGNVEKVSDTFEAFKGAVDEFINAHKSVQELLPEDGKETDYYDWYEPRIMNLNYFAKEVEIWKREIAQSKVGPLDSISNVSRKSKSSSSISSVSSELKKAKAVQAAAMASCRTERKARFATGGNQTEIKDGENGVGFRPRSIGCQNKDSSKRGGGAGSSRRWHE